MKNFMNMHPVLADVCDTVLTLLSGSFALLAVGLVLLKEHIGKKKLKKQKGCS